jgi:aminoglycoside phosphotransferase family enzyme
VTELIDRLQQHLQAGRDEPVERIETHISWVLLAGATAYKLKKPVRLPFLDFSSLAERRRFCAEEVGSIVAWAARRSISASAA